MIVISSHGPSQSLSHSSYVARIALRLWPPWAYRSGTRPLEDQKTTKEPVLATWFRA
jgi:hypothetical protein